MSVGYYVLLPTSRVASTDGDGKTSTLLVIAGGNFAQFGPRLLIGAVLPLVILDFDASKSNVGLILTGMYVLYALLQYPGGILAVRYGERSILLWALGGIVIGTVLVVFAPSLLLFGAFVLLLGAAAGLFFPPATTLVSRLYEERGGPLGILTASGAIAGIVYPAVGGIVGTQFGWRPTMALCAIITVPVLFATAQIVPSALSDDSGISNRKVARIGQLKEILTRPRVIYALVIGIMVGFTFQAFSSFFPTFLVEYRGTETKLAGVAFGVIFGISSVAQPVAGHISDRFSRSIAIGMSVTLTVVALLILLVVSTALGLVLGVVLLGFGISWSGSLQAWLLDQLTENERRDGFGLLRTVYLLLASPGSVVVGTLADVGGWIVGFGAIVLVLVATLLLLASEPVLFSDSRV